MLKICFRILFLIVIVCTVSPLLTQALTPARVLVAYNANWTGDSDEDGTQDSLQVAEYYIAKRGIPAANLIGLSISHSRYYYYTNEYPDFQADMVQPLQAKLASLGPTNIDAIVFTYGIPYTVQNAAGDSVSVDNVIMGLNYWNPTTSNVSWRTNPYFETTPLFSTDKGTFDHTTYKFYSTEMYLVTRLDGPRGVEGCLELVDQALYGDRYLSTTSGYYQGNAYVDSRNGQGGSTRYTDAYLAGLSSVQTGSYSSYGNADHNMAYAENYINTAGLPLRWENTTSSYEIGEASAEYHDFTSATVAARAILYGGWYNYGRYLDVWEWLPGAAACDLNSNSLSSLRNANANAFGTKALSRGATAVCGVTGEPYLTGHPRPNVMIYYLLQGYSFAEAASLCTPSIGWRPINVGDALYAPFATKTLVYDTQSPVLASGYPQVSFSATGDPTLTLMVDDAPEPDMARIRIEYGLTTSYGTEMDSDPGFWRRHDFTIEGLASSQTYHYRIHMEDPVGNITITTDAIFTTGIVLTPTPTRTSTATRTFTPTATITPFISTTPTPTETVFHSPTVSPTTTISRTATPTFTVTKTHTISPTPSTTSSFTPTATITQTATITPTVTSSSTVTPTPSATPTNPLSKIELHGKIALAYPNPGKDKIHFLMHLSETSSVKIVIYNLIGEKVTELDQIVNGTGQVLNWQCADVAPGMYLAVVYINNEKKGILKLGVTH